MYDLSYIDGQWVSRKRLINSEFSPQAASAIHYPKVDFTGSISTKTDRLKANEHRKMTEAAREMDRQVGNKLRELRQVSGMSLAQLAEKVELDIAALKDCEKGSRHVSATELWNFCGVFNVSPSAFFAEPG